MRAILTYHSIDASGSPISIAPAEFRRHVTWLASGRVRVVRLDELVRLPEGADAVALTFDDGFHNFADEAAPLLREYSLPATVFVVAGRVGRTNAWGGRADAGVPTLPLLDWPALGLLTERGIRLGAHSRTHPRLTRLDAAALEDELAGAAEMILKETGQRPDDLAYPYGDVNARVAAAAARHYRRGLTTDLRTLHQEEDLLRLPRLEMYYFREPGKLEAWGSAGFHGRLWMRAQARRLRASLTGAGGGGKR